jgi:hypothetical protein
MKTSQLFKLLIQILPATAAGYLLHGWIQTNKSTLAPEDLPPPSSFSEIQNAKLALRDLSIEYVGDIFTRHLEPVLRYAGGSAGASEDRARFANAIRCLEEGVAEFKGTEEELLMVRALLGLRRCERAHRQWLDLYLRVLYQYPTSPLIGQLADQAVAAAGATGRKWELLEAFEHLNQIPIEFAGKERFSALAIELAVNPTPPQHLGF